MKKLKTTVVQLTITHDKDLPDLPHLVAGRAWSIDGVGNVEVSAFAPINIEPLLKPFDQMRPLVTLEVTKTNVEIPPRWLETQ